MTRGGRASAIALLVPLRLSEDLLVLTSTSYNFLEFVLVVQQYMSKGVITVCVRWRWWLRIGFTSHQSSANNFCSFLIAITIAHRYGNTASGMIYVSLRCLCHCQGVHCKTR